MCVFVNKKHEFYSFHSFISLSSTNNASVPYGYLRACEYLRKRNGNYDETILVPFNFSSSNDDATHEFFLLLSRFHTLKTGIWNTAYRQRYHYAYRISLLYYIHSDNFSRHNTRCQIGQNISSGDEIANVNFCTTTTYMERPAPTPIEPTC